MKDIKELMEKLTELDPTIAEGIQTKLTELNTEAKNERKKKSETNTLLNDIMEKLGTTKEELPGVVDTKTNEISALTKKLNDIESNLAKAEAETLNAKLESEIVSKLNSHKVKKNFDFMRDSLKNMTKVGESGELLVGDTTLDSYIQNIIDNDVTIVDSKSKKVTKNDSSDLYTEAELEALSEEEVIANMDKVDKSMRALK